MNRKLSAKCTRWVNRALVAILIAFCGLMPSFLAVYCRMRPLSAGARIALLAAFYACCPLVLFALWSIDRLVTNILEEKVFVHKNVSLLRRIRWCCAGVSLLCVPASVFYLPLIFLVLIMGFLALAVSVMVNVMAAAVAIREENDLTI